jgi:hypothetical protein
MQGVKQRLSNTYDALFGRNQVVMDMPTAQRLGKIADQASKDLTPDEAQVVHNQIAKYTDAATKNGGSIPGDLYQSIRGQLQNLQSRDAKGALIGDVRKVMQDAANDSFKGNDAAVLKATNQQYANMKVLQKSLAGPQGAMDEVSPGSLWSKVNGKYGATPEMRALAQAGKVVLNEPPTSGSIERLIALHAMNPLTWPVAGPLSLAGATFGRAVNSKLAAQLLPGSASRTLSGLSRLIPQSLVPLANGTQQ